MRRFTRLLAALWAAVLFTAAGVSPVSAQTYPFNNPTFIPTATVDATACAAACDVVFNTGGTDTVIIRVAGTGTGVAAAVQGTEARNGTIAWTALNVFPVAALTTAPAEAGSITGVGLWRVNASGLAAVRVHLTAVTGTISISMSGNPGNSIVINTPAKKATYSASIVALAPAASATDFVTLTGSATATVRVTRAECSGITTANATATIEALVRSTANTVGTPAAMTAVPHDSNDAAASATVTAYTANPTTGTLVGIVRAAKITTGPAASATVVPAPVIWDFTAPGQQEVVLRGIAQVFALNGAGASFSAGAALNCAVSWTEE